MSTPDPVNHPAHYLTHQSGIECIQITEHLNFCLGNALKYIWRADSKGDAINDLSKAVWYLEREITRRKALADMEKAQLLGVIADCLEKDLVTKSASSPTTGTVLAYAQAGDARRQVELGIEYYYGENGRTQNYETAVEWWKLAVDQGDVEAQWLLGNAYLFGRGVEKNKEEAHRLWKLAEENREANEQKPADLVTKTDSSPNLTGTTLAYAQAGDARRQNEMGKMCYYGNGMPQDYEAAVEWWQKAAEQGNYEAQLSLANAYRKGQGVEKNLRAADYWLEQAGRQPSKGAQ